MFGSSERRSKTAKLAHLLLTRHESEVRPLLLFLLRSLLTDSAQCILVSPRSSTFTSIVQNSLKALNHLNFSSFFCFRDPRRGPSRGVKSSSFLFASLLSRVSYRALSSFSTRDNQDQGNVKSSRCLLWSFVSARLCWLCNIPDAHSNFRGHISSLPHMRCTWTRLYQASHPRNLLNISPGKKLASNLL